tara:strand:+ start:257 stop:502 length:246 start_codon:yes stop_codon:yes gene_type:complete
MPDSLKKNIIPGQNLYVGDILFGEGEVGYIARKIFSKGSYKFHVRLTSQMDTIILKCTGNEIMFYFKSGVWSTPLYYVQKK